MTVRMVDPVWLLMESVLSSPVPVLAVSEAQNVKSYMILALTVHAPMEVLVLLLAVISISVYVQTVMMVTTVNIGKIPVKVTHA